MVSGLPQPISQEILRNLGSWVESLGANEGNKSTFMEHGVVILETENGPTPRWQEPLLVLSTGRQVLQLGRGRVAGS